MKKSEWLTLFLLIYGVMMVVLMFTLKERPIWYSVANIIFLIIVNVQTWYNWQRNKKIKNVDEEEIKKLLKDGKKEEAILKVREKSKCGLVNAILYIGDLEKSTP